MKFFRPTSQKLQSAILMKKQYYKSTYVYVCFMNISDQIRSDHHPQGPIANARVETGVSRSQSVLASGVTRVTPLKIHQRKKYIWDVEQNKFVPPSYVCWFQNHLNCSFIYHIYSSEILAINQLGDSC